MRRRRIRTEASAGSSPVVFEAEKSTCSAVAGLASAVALLMLQNRDVQPGTQHE